MFDARAVVCVLAVSCAGARAQRLDLGAPPAPILTKPCVLDELRDGLAEQHRAFAGRGADPAARASAAIRTLGLALLAEPAPEERLMTGLTLASRLPLLDRVIQDIDFGDAAALLLARDALVLAHDLPADQHELDRRMRDLLAELSRACGSLPVAGWALAAEGTVEGDDVARWTAAMEGSAGAALAGLVEMLKMSRDWPVLNLGAAPLGEALARGARATFNGPAWLTDPARKALRTHFETAVRGLTAPDLRAGALAALSTLDEAAGVIELANRLPAGAASDEARARLAAFLGRAPEQVGSARVTLELVLRRDELAGERRFVRPLRPAWRVLSQRARESEQSLLSVLGRAFEVGPADPGVIGAIGSHRRSIEALEGLEALSRICAGGAIGDDPAVETSWARLAQAALESSRRIEGPENAERMLLFESLLAQAARIERAGESDRLKLEAEEDTRVCGGRVDELRRAIEAWRAQWAKDWAEQGSASARSLSRLRAIEGLLGAIDDACAWGRMVEFPGAAARLSVWELAGPALRLAGEDACEQLTETTRLVLAGEDARAVERLERWREEYALVRLAARLERDALARGVEGGEPSEASAVAELGAGAPGAGRPLHADRRAELATICRYASELVAMRRAGASEQERQLRRFLQWRAGALLEAMGPERRAAQVSSSASR